MATMDAEAIITAIREVIEDGAGSVRTITADTFRSGPYENASDYLGAAAAIVKPRAEVMVTKQVRNPAAPSVMCNLALYDLEIEVVLVRRFGADHALDGDTRTALEGLAHADGDVLAQALSWPGNLMQTSAAAPTGLIAGMLHYVETTRAGVRFDGENGVLTTNHKFRGTVRVSPAIS